MSVKKEIFVTTSTIAADLSAIQSISSDLKMSTLNAKIVTARSGKLGLAFQPLTDYATHLAGTTGEIVESISLLAVKLTRISVHLMQSQYKEKSFQLSLKKHGENSCHAQQIKDLNLVIRSETSILLKEYLSAICRMLLSIDYLKSEVRSIFYLGMNCRIEASRCGEFSNDFESIATDIEQAAERVKSIVNICQSRIENELNID